MTKTKSTKRALLASALALLMCVSMLIGSTFAWFTDSASTSISTITSGTLKIEVTDADSDGTVEFVNADGETDILWEPGCTFNTETVTVKNVGDLALKYTIHVEGASVNAATQQKLNEVIDWTINGADMTTAYSLGAGESDTFTITAHMQETASNDYQGLTLDGCKIIVSATQDTVEKDSISNQYDKKATNPDNVKLISQGTVTSDGAAVPTYYIKVTGEGSPNAVQQPGYVWFGWSVDVSDYKDTGKITNYKPDGTIKYTNSLTDEEDGLLQVWCGLRPNMDNPIYKYSIDKDGDNTADFYVVVDVSTGTIPADENA